MERKVPLTLIFFLFFASSCFSKYRVDPDSVNLNDKVTETADRSVARRQFKSLQPDFLFPEVHSSTKFFTEAYARPTTEEENSIREKIEATYKKVFEENRFVDFLDENSLLDLPVGIKTDLGVLRYVILIDSIVMTPRESFLYASMQFEMPQKGKKIHFLGKDIKFSKTGGLTGDGKLMLVGDYPINLDGEQSQLIIKGSENKTFVEFDCRGYKQLSLDASLLFSRDLLVPENSDGTRAATGNIELKFTTTVVDWNDILVNVNIPKFQVTSVQDVTFSITDATLDFSDTRNPPAVKFPQGYANTSPLLADGNLNLWQGVYIKDLTVTLPPQFKTKNEQGEEVEGSGHRVSFKGNDLVLDHLGFSGRVSANNLIPIEKGKIGNWAFSLEQIYIDIAANEIKEGGFRGKVNVPINKATTGTQNAIDTTRIFTYKALIKPGNEYLFTVSNADTLEFDLWKADVTLHPSSYIEINLEDGEFRPRAHLNGLMTMNIGLKDGEAAQDQNKNVKIAKVTFQDLEIQTVRPYIQVGSFSLGTEGGDSGMGGFPIAIKGIYGSSSGNTLSLGIDVTLGLIKESDGGFAANGKFSIVSESVESGDDLSYRFKKIEIDRFGIDIDKGAFKFKGNLNFYKEDPVYGNGISGTVDAMFEPIQLQASAIFGTRNGSRYWFADALATFNSGITIFTGVALYSFGGGAYYHMKLDDKGVGSALGKTVSGMVYVPDETVGFGLKATISIGIQPEEKSFNADATFEMAFNNGGGLRYINFRGNGYFMTTPMPVDASKVKERATDVASVSKKYPGNLNENPAAANELYEIPGQSDTRAQVWASVMINYDFDNRILHGNLKAYVNVIGGVLKGAGANGMAGEAVLHFAPNEWYIYIGRPEYENRFGLEVLGLARLDAYFVIGTTIPDTPLPPEKVSSILGGIDLDYMGELNALADGAGVGFGASFSVDTGDKTFMMFYGRFEAGMGFDIMLKNYGDAQCKGRGALGVNGWYANGQAYAYFEGTIGIRVKIFHKEKKVKILDIGAAVVAQAKLPNPAWIKGVAGGHFNVLGGLVKGKCQFEIEIGEECELIEGQQNSVLESIDVLAQATPQDNAQDVDVFTVPQAVFNYELEKEYEMVADDGQVVKFKISLDEFSIKQNGVVVTSELKWNEDKTVAALNPFEILPSEQELTLTIVTSFKEMKSGLWVVSMADGQPLKETHAVRFSTGKAPDYIPESNVAYSYPSINQYNYYKNESSDGYITLKQGQSYLFENSNEWDQVVRFRSNTGSPVEVPFTYVSTVKEVRMTMPQSLVNEKIYELSVVNVPKGYLSHIDANVQNVTASVGVADPGTELNIRTKQAEGTITENQEKQIFVTHFRTSKYNTLNDKIVSVNPSSGWRDPLMPGVHAIGSNIGGPEPFSREEIVGTERNAPLIQMEADLTNVPWYNDQVYPLVYEGYPINGILRLSSFNRDPAMYGTVPTKAVFLYQYPYNFILTDSEISSGTVSFGSPVGRFDYYLAYYMYYDYYDLANQAANYAATHGSNARLNKLITSSFPVIKKGDYWVNIRYKLPGRNTTTSTYRHKIYNPID